MRIPTFRSSYSGQAEMTQGNRTASGGQYCPATPAATCCISPRLISVKFHSQYDFLGVN